MAEVFVVIIDDTQEDEEHPIEVDSVWTDVIMAENRKRELFENRPYRTVTWHQVTLNKV